MRLTAEQARARLLQHDHGILCTLHDVRGVDAVPVVFAVDEDDHLGVPIDRVKPKSTSRLQRERNLDADPRATLLVEHWDRDDCASPTRTPPGRRTSPPCWPTATPSTTTSRSPACWCSESSA
jgi:hypothetical protein